MQRLLFDPESTRVFMAAIDATYWLNENLQAWLGEKNADALTQSVPNNVTSEMGLALLDVADVIRAHPDVVTFLRHVEDDDFLDRMSSVSGGPEARAAIQACLDEYGMRCVGEIDVTKPRWSERPTTLLPILLGHVANFDRGAGARRFERGREEAAQKEHDLLSRLRPCRKGTARPTRPSAGSISCAPSSATASTRSTA
jgi:pyruvate,water dikinase